MILCLCVSLGPETWAPPDLVDARPPQWTPIVAAKKYSLVVWGLRVIGPRCAALGKPWQALTSLHEVGEAPGQGASTTSRLVAACQGLARAAHPGPIPQRPHTTKAYFYLLSLRIGNKKYNFYFWFWAGFRPHLATRPV